MKPSRTHAPALAPTRKLNVLIACEESQAECTAFRQLGHNAYSCDIQPCRPKTGHPEWHILGDVTPLLDGATEFTTQDGTRCTIDHWDLIIAHPPCTYLCKISSVHMAKRISPIEEIPDGWFADVDDDDQNTLLIINEWRYKQMKKARQFFLRCWNTNAAHYLAVENPLPMARAKLPKPTTFIDPSWFGVKYTKKTLYWLRNLPPILPTIEHPTPRCFVTASRGKYRSRTFPQVAQAIAQQWSQYILNDLADKSQ